MTNYKQLCADLVAWAEKTSAHCYSEPGVLIRARAALAKPEPEGPTREESVALYSEVMATHECQTLGDMAEHFSRAVLARWGNHPAKPDTSLQPIPVSERMPEPVPLSERPWEREEWCDEQGRCWWFDSADPGWVFDTPETCQHWSSFVLPAHALPLPTHD